MYELEHQEIEPPYRDLDDICADIDTLLRAIAPTLHRGMMTFSKKQTQEVSVPIRTQEGNTVCIFTMTVREPYDPLGPGAAFAFIKNPPARDQMEDSIRDGLAYLQTIQIRQPLTELSSQVEQMIRDLNGSLLE